MNRRLYGCFLALVLGTVAVDALAAPPAKPPAKPAAGKGAKAPTKEATTVASLAPMLDGLKWGMSPEEVVKQHNQVQGIFDKEFNEELVGMSNGIKMQEKMAERETAKIAFASIKRFDAASHIVYPGLEGEYTHGNKEAAHIRDGLKGRKGDRRFFFYIGERLWKIYDVVTFGTQNGQTFEEASSKIAAKLGAAGTPMAAADKGIPTAFLGWQDATTQLRLIEREGDKKFVIVLEDKATLSAIPQLRVRKDVDPTAELGADVAAATRGSLQDPSQQQKTDKTPADKKTGKPPAAKR